MHTPWADWLAVGLAVGGAVLWLAWRLRRNWRRQQQAKTGSGACAGGCDGCPFGKDCGSRPPP
jgi:hypothetical protein